VKTSGNMPDKEETKNEIGDNKLQLNELAGRVTGVKTRRNGRKGRN